MKYHGHTIEKAYDFFGDDEVNYTYIIKDKDGKYLWETPCLGDAKAYCDNGHHNEQF